MRTIGAWMIEALKSPDDNVVLARIRSEIRQLCQQFPVPAAALTE
jgi:glycine hydroxymethyltransferase